MSPLSPRERLARYGPTTGDRVRLADTDLWVVVGEDRQAHGDEPLWGYAKTIRPRSAQGRPSPSELDVVIAGALVVDPVIGCVKADIGIKDGRIVGVGRAGSGAISDGIDLPIGPHTQPIMGYGLIATPGAVDSHVHVISPALFPPPERWRDHAHHRRVRRASVGDGSGHARDGRLASQPRTAGGRASGG
jgi:urease subunit alpha